MLGERIPAEQAAEWGMISRVVEDEAAGSRRRWRSPTRLAQGPTVAYGLIRKLARDAEQSPLSRGARRRADRPARGRPHRGFPARGLRLPAEAAAGLRRDARRRSGWRSGAAAPRPLRPLRRTARPRPSLDIVEASARRGSSSARISLAARERLARRRRRAGASGRRGRPASRGTARRPPATGSSCRARSLSVRCWLGAQPSSACARRRASRKASMSARVKRPAIWILTSPVPARSLNENFASIPAP